MVNGLSIDIWVVLSFEQSNSIISFDRDLIQLLSFS